MLYLAEVKKQTRTFLGGLKSDLKLLACQHSDQTWSALPSEEILTIEDIETVGEGTLWMLQLSNNRQLQGKPDIAAPEVVRQLQKLSRLSEKLKDQQEEIEQWKQSLTFQSQELARREMEIDTRESEIEEKSGELAQLNRQQQEINQAWDRLEVERRQLQSLQQQFGNLLDLPAEQTEQIQSLINRFAIHPDGLRAIATSLQTATASVNQQQNIFNNHWQNLDKFKAKVAQLHQEVQRKDEILAIRRQELESVRTSLADAKTQLVLEQNILTHKQELLRQITLEMESTNELQKTLYRIATGSVGTAAEQKKVDTAALEVMPLNELEDIIQHLQAELDKLVRFVNDQEEELTVQCQAVEELQTKLSQANDYERMTIEEELSEEQERKRMLDETLVGQRRNLKERQDILVQHLRILRRRQGIVDLDNNYASINLDPVIEQLEGIQGSNQEIKQKLEADLQHLNQSLKHIQEMIHQLERENESKGKDLQQEENAWKELQRDAMQIETQIRTYELTLQPLQNQLDAIRPQFEELSQWLLSD
ncbi:MAG: pilus motility taxis protein HmpF [Snowella sp.]|nr:pilus motility taxis protein HmpF [Snowella sp.]